MEGDNNLKAVKWLSTKEAKEKKWIDAAASIIIGVLIIIEAILSNNMWGTKTEPFVKLTWGHLTFPLLTVGLFILWFIVVRKYSFDYLGFKKAKKRFWYFIAPLGMVIGFGFGIPTYILLTNLFPVLKGGGMASTPPMLGYPLYIVLLVESIKYPLVSAVPHNVAWRGAVFQSINRLGKHWFLFAFLISTAFYIGYHLPFDFSFSAFYFNLIWNIIAIFLLVKSDSIYPPIIFHAFINYFAIFSSWGYYLGN